MTTNQETQDALRYLAITTTLAVVAEALDSQPLRDLNTHWFDKHPAEVLPEYDTLIQQIKQPMREAIELRVAINLEALQGHRPFEPTPDEAARFQAICQELSD